MDEKPISFTEYGRHRGVTRQAVQQYVESGKISRGVHVNEETGHKKIWLSVADQELGGNVLSASYPQAAENGRGGKPKAVKPDPKPKQAPPLKPPELDAPSGDNLVALKRQQTQIKIQSEAIKLKKLKGELLDKTQVQERLFAFGKMIRDAIMAVPDRVTDDVMAERTRGGVHRLLYSTLEDALRQLASLDEIEF